MEEIRRIESIESLSTLTAGVAHEIKNPLNSMNIHAQLAKKSLKDLREEIGANVTLERIERSNRVIMEEIERLAKIVDGFLDAVRPARPNIRTHDLNKVLLGVAELIGPDCRSRGIELVLDLDPELTPVRIDADQILQCVLNVAKNAMESIEGEHGAIALRTKLKSDHVLIEVEDNGCGIPDEERLRIFEPYHTTKESGTGLGLMVVYRIVRAHRGAVGLRSEPGKGTVFSIGLPIDERPVRLLEAQVDPPYENAAPE
jgi:signal transduction histidine kinase